MLVYRVQNWAGRGPYTVEHSLKNDLLDAHHDRSTHPTISHDGLRGFTLAMCEPDGPDKIWLCGFTKHAILKEWFGDWIPRLKTVGYGIALYKVPAKFVRKGRKQLIFKKSEAKLLTFTI